MALTVTVWSCQCISPYIRSKDMPGMRDNSPFRTAQDSIPLKTIQIHQYGGPEVLQRIDAPVPAALPGTVLVRVHHAGTTAYSA